ncbi:GntR family transcriptional regulator [Parasediminibacterium sp. JCM 36343]|uniref:GntR family transcriptional regulator n=1 Tax=Parasediminibacterium sp. JCM 36343 TaxID=3374279 RepID=UPI00397B14DD
MASDMAIDFPIDFNDKMPLYLQISKVITEHIDNNILKNGATLPSINTFNEQYNVARGTVEKAYKQLKKTGYIDSVPGKGYFVSANKESKIKVLFIFNKISSHKRIIYDSFLLALGDNAVIDLQIYHYKTAVLKNIIDENISKYHYYVVMPYFEKGFSEDDCLAIFNNIPNEQLVLLDNILPGYPTCKGVYQDFCGDIFTALKDVYCLMTKYTSITLLYPDNSNHPIEIVNGVKQFSKEYKLPFSLATKVGDINIIKGSVYIVIADEDLVVLIKKIRQTDYQLGVDIGIVSFNESELKNLMDITVVTTDFKKMGTTAAELILTKTNALIKNPFQIIKRGSL